MGGRRARPAGSVALGVLLAVVVTAGCQPPPYSWDRQLASEPSGPSTGGGRVDRYVFSADATKVAFVSDADDLGPTDTNGFDDVYVRDLVSGSTTLVSANAAGTDSGDRTSTSPVFSPDGTKVAFLSRATDLVGGSMIGDLYVRDLTTATTTLVTVSADGTLGISAGTSDPRFTPDGTKLIFTTEGHGFGPVDTNETYDVYMRDLVAGTTTLLSTNAAGTDSGNSFSRSPLLTRDGRAVVFTSEASDLGTVDSDNTPDVYMRDLVAGTTTLLSTNASGTDSALGASDGLAVSPDGRRVAFLSDAGDLGPRDTNRFFDLYVRDLDAGTTTLVSANAAGTNGGDASTFVFSGTSRPGIAFSPEGNQVAFSSHASNLVTNDHNQFVDVFVRDLAAGRTRLVSVNAAGTGSGNNSSFGGTFSADGSALAFDSQATDLGPLDTNGTTDVYVRDLVHDVTGLVSTNAAGDDSANDWAGDAVFAPAGDRIAFRTAAKDIGLPSSQHDWDLVVADGRQAGLSVTLDATPGSIPSGAEVSYHVRVANAGPSPAVDARMALLLPERVTFRRATANAGACQPPQPGQVQVVVCGLGDLGPGDDATVTVTAAVDAPPGTALIAVAGASSATGDPDHTDNAARQVLAVS